MHLKKVAQLFHQEVQQEESKTVQEVAIHLKHLSQKLAGS